MRSALFCILIFLSLVHAEDYTCPSGKSKKTIKIRDGDSFSFTIPDNYAARTKCTVNYKLLRRSCKRAYFFCNSFDLPNRSGPPSCRKGDKLRVGRKSYCKTNGPPETEFTRSLRLMFTSDKRTSGAGAQCTIICGSGVSPTPPPPTPSPGPTIAPGSCQCGIANRVSRIVGGQNADVNEYPWQAGIVSKGSVRPWCGGSLVNSKWVLTAAHCTAGESASGIQVLLGDHKTNQNDHVVFNVAAIQDHPDYNSQTTDYDFSMLQLATAVDFDAHADIRPVCLPPAGFSGDYAEVIATVTGWGTTSSGGSQSTTLKEVDVGVITNQQCRNNYGYSSSWITDSMLCAVVPGGGKDACQGDSGGPLVANQQNYGQNYELIGVVSWGIGCADANHPGVYARVTNQLSWVRTWMATDGAECPA